MPYPPKLGLGEGGGSYQHPTARGDYYLNFNGSSYGEFTGRVAALDADSIAANGVRIEIFTAIDGDGTVISQNISNTPTSREFQIYQLAATGIYLIAGGVSTIIAPAQSDGTLPRRYVFTLRNDGTYAVEKNGIVIGSGSFEIGTKREPTAIAALKVRNPIPTFVGSGVLGDVKITNISTKYVEVDCPLASVGSDTQENLAEPANPITLTSVVHGSDWTTVAAPITRLLDVETLIFHGASLTQRSTAAPAEEAYIADIAAHLGFSATNIRNTAVAGQTIPQSTNTWINNVKGTTDRDLTGVILVTNGNDASYGRPYATDANANTGMDSQLAADWQTRFDTVAQDALIIATTSTTFRAYESAPAVDPNDENTFDNGMRPYNENIFIPKVLANSPMFSKNGVPTLNGEKYTSDRPWIVATADGIHLEDNMEPNFLEHFLYRAYETEESPSVNPSGRKFIFYVAPTSEFLNQGISGANSMQAFKAKVRDSNDVYHKGIYAEFCGCAVPSSGGDTTNGPARITDTDLQDPLLLGTLHYGSGSNELSNIRAPYAEFKMGGLEAGLTGSVTVVACRAASSSTSRVGNMQLNGVDTGSLDGANNAASNQWGPYPFTVQDNGTISVKAVPDSAGGYAYIGAVKVEFD